MAPLTVSGLFTDDDKAFEAVRALKALGIPDHDISVVTRQDRAISQDLTAGKVIGGVSGWLAGALAVDVPGVGPLIAAGPLAASMVGMVGGGLIGALVDYGIHPGQGETYKRAIHEGHVLVAASAVDGVAVARVLKAAGAVQVDRRLPPR